MLRFAGILTGSALAIVLIVLTMGTPRFATPVQARDDFQAAAPPASPVELPALELAAPSEHVAAGNTARSTDSRTERPVAAQRPAPEPGSVETAEAVPEPESGTPQIQPANWYAFWSPFRSEIAADGFVTRLQQTTGMDYRVLKLKPGVYEVAFAYTDDNDRADKLQRISAATGLDLSGG